MYLYVLEQYRESNREWHQFTCGSPNWISICPYKLIGQFAKKKKNMRGEYNEIFYIRFLGSSAVDGKRFLETNASSIRGTLM